MKHILSPGWVDGMTSPSARASRRGLSFTSLAWAVLMSIGSELNRGVHVISTNCGLETCCSDLTVPFLV